MQTRLEKAINDLDTNLNQIQIQVEKVKTIGNKTEGVLDLDDLENDSSSLILPGNGLDYDIPAGIAKVESAFSDLKKEAESNKKTISSEVSNRVNDIITRAKNIQKQLEDQLLTSINQISNNMFARIVAGVTKMDLSYAYQPLDVSGARKIAAETKQTIPTQAELSAQLSQINEIESQLDVVLKKLEALQNEMIEKQETIDPNGKEAIQFFQTAQKLSIECASLKSQRDLLKATYNANLMKKTTADFTAELTKHKNQSNNSTEKKSGNPPQTSSLDRKDNKPTAQTQPVGSNDKKDTKPPAKNSVTQSGKFKPVQANAGQSNSQPTNRSGSPSPN